MCVCCFVFFFSALWYFAWWAIWEHPTMLLGNAKKIGFSSFMFSCSAACNCREFHRLCVSRLWWIHERCLHASSLMDQLSWFLLLFLVNTYRQWLMRSFDFWKQIHSFFSEAPNGGSVSSSTSSLKQNAISSNPIWVSCSLFFKFNVGRYRRWFDKRGRH